MTDTLEDILESDNSISPILTETTLAEHEAQPIQIFNRNELTKRQMWEAGIIASNLEFRFNERRVTYEVLLNNSWQAMDDMTEAYILDELLCPYMKTTDGTRDQSGNVKVKPFTMDKNDFGRCVHGYCFHRRVDPFKDWLLALPEIEISPASANWLTAHDTPFTDGVGLGIDRILFNLFGQEPQNYSKWGVDEIADRKYYAFVMRHHYLAMICRTFHPGCKVDLVPIIAGEQGAGKDTMFYEIPPIIDGRPLVKESFDFGERMADLIQSTFGYVTIISSEMAGLRFREQNSLKSFITTKNDVTRIPYDKHALDIPRKFVLVTTSNSSHPVPADPTGNRRWLPVELQESRAKCRVEDWFNEKIDVRGLPDQYTRREVFWMEAMALYNANPDPLTALEMPEYLREVQRIKCEAYSPSNNAVEDPIEDALKRHNVDKDIPLMPSAVAVMAGLAETPDDTAKITSLKWHELDNAMAKRGYKKHIGKTVKVFNNDRDSIRKDLYIHKSSSLVNKGIPSKAPYDFSIVKGHIFTRTDKAKNDRQHIVDYQENNGY